MNRCPRCQRCFAAVPFICPKCNFTPLCNDGIEFFIPEFDATSAGFTEDAFEKLYASEEKSFWFRSRNRLIIWTLKRFFPQLKNFMELGCGTGYVLNAIANAFITAELTGSELFPTGLSFAKKRLGQRIRPIQMDARQIPFYEEFDVIGAFDVLEHIKEDRKVLDQIYSALNPGGGLIITVPQHQKLWSPVDEIARHERRYSRRDLVEKVEKAGFKCVFASSFVSFLLPMMFASRINQANSQKVSSELELPFWLDCLFEDIMRLEFYAIRKGIDFPIGGSLILIGKKA